MFEYMVKPGVARLFVARHEQEVVAAILFATLNKKAYSVFSGSTDFGYKAGAQSGLFWCAVETFKDEGFILLNRGGVPAAAESKEHVLHGIYRFKHRLGTTPLLCRSGEKVLRPVRDSLNKLKERVGAIVGGG
jgi:lipid II:glycine glycyltransferase (peptidoglycan interpeptide bridge formation enzyme)